MAGVALSEVLAQVQRRYKADQPTRELHRRVADAITLWARGEHLSAEDVSLGMTLAAATVAAHGANTEQIAQLGLDPAAAAEEVLARAKDRDGYWGSEPHYAVAQRCVEETYQVLINQLRTDEAVVLPTVLALRQDLAGAVDHGQAQGRLTLEALAGLAGALVALGSLAEVRTYLQVRIADWDASYWFPTWHAPSAVEQRLRLRETSDRSGGDPGDLSAAEALEGQRMLVVLGAPGAGKTWLARRYAREAAYLALSELDAGALLDEVELPLLTRWGSWDKTADARAGLIATSFAADLGHSDIGGGQTAARLGRTFAQHQRILVVLDALDEAADLADQAASLRALTSLERWRVVVTSRPAAWEATRRGAPTGPGSAPRVAELQPLTYPDDVEAFVRAWFATEPERGARLVDQVRARADLRRAATIPLILTFYCILAEESTSGDQQLPARRRDLYQRLVLKLLRGAWSPGGPGTEMALDPQGCQDTLKAWAWHGVHDRVTPAGLGNWGETFIQPTPLAPGLARAVDHVAPKQQEKDFQVTRRFVHRTVLEHFVAEYIADQDTQRAFNLLLPHLWFDPDWQIAAPAAIAEHNRRHRGELLDMLLDAAHPSASDPARRAANEEFDMLLLSIAAESDPGDWTPEHQNLIDACRAANALNFPDHIAATTHWINSHQIVFARTIAALSNTDLGAPYIRADVLTALATTSEERSTAYTAILNALFINSFKASFTSDALPALATTDEERFAARTAVLDALPYANPRTVSALADTLLDLGATSEEQATARAAVLRAIPHADLETGGYLAKTLVALSTTSEERSTARTAALDALPHADPWTANYLADALLNLKVTSKERATTRAAVLDAFIHTSTLHSNYLSRVLATLATTSEERAATRATVLNTLVHVPTMSSLAVYMADVLTTLATTSEERVTTRAAVLDALPEIGEEALCAVVEILPALEATSEEQATARTTLLIGLPQVIEQVAHTPIRVPLALRSCDETVLSIAKTLPILGATSKERAIARAAVFKAMIHIHPLIAIALAEALPALATTSEERATARAVVLNIICESAISPETPIIRGRVVRDSINILMALDANEKDCAQIRAAVLRILPEVQGWMAQALVEVLRRLSLTQWWQDWLTDSSTH